MSENILILPGIGGSGPDHWQTYWELSHPQFKRVQQRDWDNPLCQEWKELLEKTISQNPGNIHNTVLIAHSLACLLVAHWAATTKHKIRGALLVAPPDPQSAIFPMEAISFAPTPLQRLPFSSRLIASTNDPYGTLNYANNCAEAWGSHFVNIGDLGHINSASHLENWETGLIQLASLLRDTENLSS